jgi:hypothetical protein
MGVYASDLFQSLYIHLILYIFICDPTDYTGTYLYSYLNKYSYINKYLRMYVYVHIYKHQLHNSVIYYYIHF